MNTMDCEVIRDILPLYAEGIASNASKKIVEEHLKECDECNDIYLKMREKTNIIPESLTPFKKISKEIKRNKLAAVSFLTALVFSITVTVFSFITSPEYIPYSEDLISVSKLENGGAALTFNDSVTGYSSVTYESPEGYEYVDVIAWSTPMDKSSANKGSQTLIIDSSTYKAYYLTGNSENKVIYEAHPISTEDEKAITLPRLALGYYIFVATGCSLILGVLWILLKVLKRKTAIAKKLFFIPISYIIAHLCIKGTATVTYLMVRDLSLILLTAAAIYIVIISGTALFRFKKREKIN